MRLTLPRMVLTLTMTAILIFATTAFKGCTKEQLVSSAQDVFDSLSTAQPYIAQLLPGKAAKFAEAVKAASKLITAVKLSDKTEALSLLADITPVISDIVRDLGGNTQVLTALALADIGLHFLVNHVKAPTALKASTQMAAITQYKSEPMWGCKYRPEKCK